MYLRAVRQAIQQSSIYVQKAAVGKRSSVASQLSGSKFMDVRSFIERWLIRDEHVEMITLEPKQVVDLQDWTAYYRPTGMFKEDSSHEDTMLLLEAFRPSNVERFLEQELEVSPAEKIHILAHGEAVAWKSGMPFGIILHCSLEEFVTLAMAFCDGKLTMDEDLEVSSIMTVSVEGKSASLLPPEESAQSVNNIASRGRPLVLIDKVGDVPSDMEMVKPMDRLLARTVEQDQNTDLWSNESLASNSTVGRSELLDILDSENQALEDGDGPMMESGSGEGLYEFEMEEASSVNSGSLSRSWGFIRHNSVSKPPNVLVYTGKIDSVRKFLKVKNTLEQCLDMDCYIIYHLKHEDIDSSPWVENTTLLIIATKKSYADSNKAFMEYFMFGGRILSLGSGFDSELVGQKLLKKDNWITTFSYKNWKDVCLVSGLYTYIPSVTFVENTQVKKLATDVDGNDVIVKINLDTKTSSGCAILSQVLFDKEAGDYGVTPEMFNALKKSNTARLEILTQLLTTLGLECNPQVPPNPTPAVLFSKTDEIKSKFLESINYRLSGVSGLLKSGTLGLHFCDYSVPVQDNILPVVIKDVEPVLKSFNRGEYCENLKSRVLGNTVLYLEVIPTTMSLLDGLLFSVPDDIGLIAIAGRQTSGIGRGGNSWLSPLGCAMFSLHVKMPLESKLGKVVSYLQHITSLAVVWSVCKLPGYEEIDIRLKWPNDIYYGREMKLGGVIVKSTFMEGIVHATIGCGFNVNNSNPTICINDLVQLHNRQEGMSLATCTCEQLIARTVTYIEELIDLFQQEGAESFKKLYYEKWLHRDAKVTLQSEGNQEVKIIGLDDYGYLLVETAKGEKISVQPDGNSFDMMKNLISLKSR